jgi:uncharacterized protein (DUF3820 family)
MTDQDVMPFGKHKGLRMANVPPEYLIWLYESNLKEGPVRTYIHENWDVLKEEVKQKKEEAGKMRIIKSFIG